MRLTMEDCAICLLFIYYGKLELQLRINNFKTLKQHVTFLAFAFSKIETKQIGLI